MHTDLVVQMRPGGAARLSHVADNLATGHMFAGYHRHRRKVSIQCHHVVAMSDRHFATVAGAKCRIHHVAIRRGAHRRAVRSSDVDPSVKCALAVDRVLTLTETRGYAAFE